MMVALSAARGTSAYPASTASQDAVAEPGMRTCMCPPQNLPYSVLLLTKHAIERHQGGTADPSTSNPALIPPWR